MTWTQVLAADAVSPDKRQVVKVGKQNILLFYHEGQLFAVDNICPHLKLSLKKGKIEKGAIVCPWHRSAFDLQTGDVKDWSSWPPVMGKVLGTISKEQTLKVFPVRVEKGNIWVDVEE